MPVYKGRAGCPSPPTCPQLWRLLRAISMSSCSALLFASVRVDVRLYLHHSDGRIRNHRAVAVFTAGKEEYSQ